MATETEKPDAPKSTFDELKGSVDAIFGGNKGLQPGQLKQLNQYINEFGKAARVDQPNYKVYKWERDAVLRMIRDNGMAGIDRANNPGFKGTFVKTGVSTDDLGKDDYLKVLAATVVNGFVEKSQDLTPKQKNDAKTSVESNVTPILNTNKEWAKLYRTCNDTQKIADAKNPTFNKGWQNTTKQVLLGAITIPGIIGSIKAMFRPKDDGTKKGFWEQVGNLAKVAGFAFVAYNMVYHKRGVHETIDNTRQTIGQWTGMVNNRRDAAKGLEFGKPVGVPSL